MPTIIQDNDLLINGTVSLGKDPFDLTGCNIRFGIFDRNGAELVEKTIGDGVAITNAALGEYTVDLTSADTAALPVGGLIMETMVIDADGNQYTVRKRDKEPETLTVLRSYIK